MGGGHCKQTRLASADALGYKIGTCDQWGYYVKTTKNGMTWYDKPSRRLVFEKEGTVMRYFIETPELGGHCKQSLYESAVALGYKPGKCADFGYTVKSSKMGFEWWDKPKRMLGITMTK